MIRPEGGKCRVSNLEKAKPGSSNDVGRRHLWLKTTFQFTSHPEEWGGGGVVGEKEPVKEGDIMPRY